MTTTELRAQLMQEHKRDRNLTLLGFALITLLLILIYVFAWKYVLVFINSIATPLENADNNYGTYYKIGFIVVFCGYLLYPIYRLYKLSTRPKKIDEFIAKVEGGAIAQNITQHTVYKIIIPLLKLKLNLCPVENVMINLDDKTLKTYNFPIAKATIQEMKPLLSGSSSKGIDKAWYDIYSDEIHAENITSDSLKTEAEFQSFLDNELQSDLDGLEGERIKGKNSSVIMMIVSVLILIGFGSIIYLMATKKIELSNTMMIGGFIGFFAIFYTAMYLFKIRGKSKGVDPDFKHKFKFQVFEKMVHFINPSFHYILHGHISLAEFLATGFFQEKHYDLDGNDQIIGKYNGVPFQFCDLTAHRKRNLSNEKTGPDQVFYGQFFIAKFNKSFKDEVYLVPKKSGGNSIMAYTQHFGETVKLEDPEFMKLYNVYSNNQTEARRILSAAFMMRIKNLTLRTKGNYFISFKDNRITVANNSSKNNFEASMFKSLTKKNAMVNFYKDLCDELTFIDDLKLNINIWKK